MKLRDLVGLLKATYTGSILTRVGARGFGEKLPSYIMHRASATYKTDRFELQYTLYLD